MSGEEPMPASYPIAAQDPPKRRRAAFSRAFAGLEIHHAAPPTMPLGEEARRRRVRQDDSLRLIEDLTNRPVDPMFSDSRLGRSHRSPLEIWATRIIVFLVCIAVGLAGSVLVRQLRTDPRKEVRQSLASQYRQSSDEASELTRQVSQLQSEIATLSSESSTGPASRQAQQDSMDMGTLKVHGPGLEVTLADPLAASTGAAGGERLRVVTDLDIQRIVVILWQAGAEAIAINGHRLGPQTSIRAAGGAIMIGLESVGSPYQISAIGDRDDLSDALSAREQPELTQEFRQAGITLQTKRVKDITLEAAVTGDLRYARKAEE